MDLRLPDYHLPDDLLTLLHELAALDGIPAVLYARISVDREGNILGERRQIKESWPLFERYGLRLVGLYLDNDVSADSDKPRPDYEAMLERLAEDARGLVLWHPDRAYRRPPDLERLIKIVEACHTVVHTKEAGEVDLTTATGRAMARTAAVWQAHEVEHAKERMRAAKRQAAELGRFRGGPRPFGYEHDGVVVREREADMIRQAARRLLAGESLRSVVADWNASGVLPPASNSTRWRATTVKRTMIRARNAGLSELDGVMYPAEWMPIIKEAEFRRLRTVLTDPSRATDGTRDRTRLGSGLFLCGVCAKVETTVTLMAGPKGLYRCREQDHLQRLHVPIDKYVVEVIGKVLARPETRLRIYEASDEDLAALEAEIADLDEKLDELARERGRRQIDGREYRLMAEPMKADLLVLRSKHERSMARSPLAGIANAKDVAAAWKGATLDRKRAVIADLAVVTVGTARPGRQPGGGYFDEDSIDIVPKDL